MLLSLEGVRKCRQQGDREVVVLDDAWLAVDEGDHLGVWAGRRSGKSTLLQLAAGIQFADSGVVRFEGRNLADLADRERAQLRRSRISYVPSSLDRWTDSWSRRVAEHVSVPLVAAGWSGQEAVARAWKVLKQVGAERCGDMRLGDLSLGESTRVGIARALISGPRLLLVDEPGGTPSPTEQDEIGALLREIGRDPSVALVVASEEPALLRGATQIVSLSVGRLLTSERRGEVVDFPRAARRRGSRA